MNNLLIYLQAISGLIIFAESLNKLERTKPIRKNITVCKCTQELLKAFAWGLLAIGGAGSIITSIGLYGVSLHSTAITLGFAVLIINTRIKEG